MKPVKETGRRGSGSTGPLKETMLRIALGFLPDTWFFTHKNLYG